ncbi:MAG: BamA/TamA family outer membrane protein [Deltaproteobacteria bacterium]|nr:BamA/TamA family outer membrane protein [Deltaproteobacteria bacterium]
MNVSPVIRTLLVVCVLAGPTIVPRQALSLIPEKHCVAGPILSSRLDGCDVPRCQTPGFPEILLDLADLAAGRVLDPAGLEAARQRLVNLGFFRTVDVICSGNESGLDVVVRVQPRTQLTEIRIKGHKHFYLSALVDRLAIRHGDYLDRGQPRTQEVLRQVREVIGGAYEEEGFHGTRVTTTLLGAGKGLVELEIQVEEGKRLKIASIDATLSPASGLETDSESDPEWSCPVIRTRDLRNWAGVAVGNPFNKRTVTSSMQNLKRALRTIGFSAVKVSARFDEEERLLSIRASYGACHLLRFFVRDAKRPGRTGYRPLVELELLERLPFGDSGVFDLTEATFGMDEVRRFFLNRGFLLADVAVDYRDRKQMTHPGTDGHGIVPGPSVAGVITYFVTTNGHREIRAIRLMGNKHLPDTLILDAMKTKPYDFFGDAGALLPEQVLYDLERIRQLYRQNGFRRMKFQWTSDEPTRQLAISEEGPDRVFLFQDGESAFQVRSPRGTEGIYLEIGVEEGSRDVLGEVQTRGMGALSEQEVRKVLALEPGGPFSKSNVTDAVGRLSRRYSDEGYLGAKVSVSCHGHDPEVPREACTLDGLGSSRIDLELDIDEGIQTRVRAVFVEGNERTLDTVILKDFPAQGDPYRIGDVADAVKELKNLGIFTSVQVKAVGARETPPRPEVVLVVHCSEDRTRFVDIAAGFEDLNRSGEFPSVATSVISTSLAIEDRSSTGYGRNVALKIPDILLTAEVRYTDLNFLGRGKRLYLPLKYGLSSTAWDRYASFAPSYVDPRFFARSLTFRFTPFAVYDRATTRLDLFLVGAEFAVSKELFPHLYGSLTYEIAGVTSRDPGITSEYSVFRLENKLRPTLTYDRLDHPIDPKRGGLLQASLSYINAYTSENFNNYLKFVVSTKFFWTVRDFLTFGFMARFGTSRSFGGSVRLPDEERFTLGGNRGVRGFANDGVAQYNADGSLKLERTADGRLVKPHGGDNMISGSVEVRFPIFRKLGLNGAVFYDLGALSDRLVDFTSASFRHSVGVGVRFLIAGAVPIRLDYGVILDRRCSEVDPQTGLCALREEVGNIHFGLLYTF